MTFFYILFILCSTLSQAGATTIIDLNPLSATQKSLLPEGTAANPYHTHSDLRTAIDLECKKQNIQPDDLFLISTNGGTNSCGEPVRNVYFTPAVETAVTAHALQKAIENKVASEQSGHYFHLSGAMRGAGLGFSSHPEAITHMHPEHLKTMASSFSNEASSGPTVSEEKWHCENPKSITCAVFDDTIDTAKSTALLLLKKYNYIGEHFAHCWNPSFLQIYTTYLKRGHPSAKFDAFWDPNLSPESQTPTQQPEYYPVSSLHVRVFLRLMHQLLSKHASFRHIAACPPDAIKAAISVSLDIMQKTYFYSTISDKGFEELVGNNPQLISAYLPQSCFHSCPSHQQLSNALGSVLSESEVQSMAVVFPLNADIRPETSTPYTSEESMNISLGFSNTFTDIYQLDHQTMAVNASTGEIMYESICDITPQVAIIVGNKDAKDYNPTIVESLSKKFSKVLVFNKKRFATENTIWGDQPYLGQDPDIKIHKFQVSETECSGSFRGFSSGEVEILKRFLPNVTELPRLKTEK